MKGSDSPVPTSATGLSESLEASYLPPHASPSANWRSSSLLQTRLRSTNGGGKGLVLQISSSPVAAPPQNEPGYCWLCPS